MSTKGDKDLASKNGKIKEYSDEIGEKIAKEYEKNDLNFSLACDKSGVCSRTARGWVGSNEPFTDMLDEAEERIADGIFQATCKKAKENPTAANTVLKDLRANRFGSSPKSAGSSGIDNLPDGYGKESIRIVLDILVKEDDDTGSGSTTPESPKGDDPEKTS